MPPSAQKQFKHIGLFGGSFNPVHNGHLQAANAVLSQLELDRCRFILAAQSPFKSRPAIKDKHRIAMLKLAFSPYKLFDIDTQELQRKSPSFTIDTLRHIQKNAPNNHYYFILGMDAWLNFEQWKNWQEIIKLCHLVVITRPDYSQPSLNNFWQARCVNSTHELRQTNAGKLTFISAPNNDAASSNIRGRIHKGLPIGQYLPTKVAQYIASHHLYKN